MLAVSPNSIVRSSLEEMLDNLQRKGDIEKPKDLPPALPARPNPMARARPPSMKRRCPILENGSVYSTNYDENVSEKEESKKARRSSFGVKKVKEIETSESPYGKDDLEAELENSWSRFRKSEWDENIDYFMNKKLQIWCRLWNGEWGSGLIQSTSGDKASILLCNGNVITVSTGDISPANPDILEGVDDLLHLSYLNEPSVIHNLDYRYSRDMIYSKAGPVLIAMNPLKDVQLYGNEAIMAYKQKLLNSPHVYAVAHTAYNQMITEETDQSIIISGESGAGKTESAKFAMQYLSALGGGREGVDLEIMQTSCVLETFGNAKTSINNNSSRFGKLMEIHFSEAGKVCGAKIQTFLLEKSRVVQLAQGERSYHIFYQLCAGASSTLKDKLKLKEAHEYNYLKQSNCFTIDGVNDGDKFHKLVEALTILGISKDDQEHVFEMVSAVLWLGNISFKVIDRENHIELPTDDYAVNCASSLLGCSAQELVLTLSTRRLQAGKDKFVKTLTLHQATDTRDALAKFIYASLFKWLLQQINKSLAIHNQHSGRSISILDIYGFESLKKNSFDQLCINYANERLHQHFIRHLFKLKQEEYELDGIDWTKVDFKDNQECLDVFEKESNGIISLLDKELNIPKATDSSFVNKIKQELNGKPCFKEESGGAFSVEHYAGEVVYETRGFLEKNRDSLHSDNIQLLASCKAQLPQLFAASFNQSYKTSTSLMQSRVWGSPNQSVATKYKDELFELMQKLDTTTPHFIQCIKPNMKQLPGMYDNDLVLEQLRSCEVFEVVKMSRLTYPTQLTHEQFIARYGFVLEENGAFEDPLSTTISILQKFNIHPEMYQVGYTKIYFRAGQMSALEDLRKGGTVAVQKCFLRAHEPQSYLDELKGGVLTIQSFVRGEIGRRKYEVILKQKEVNEQLKAVLQIQSGTRGWLARKLCSRLRKARKLIHDIRKPGTKVSQVKDLPQEMLYLIVEELQKRVIIAEASLDEKEKENTTLKEQVVDFEKRWSEYEAKMKSLEDTCHKQMTSLQASLSAAKTRLTLATDISSGQLITRPNSSSPSPLDYDSENTSMETHTPGETTPTNNNAGLDAVNQLVREFEQRKQTFGVESKAIIEVKSSSTGSGSLNPAKELRRLKHQFNAWKKEYKVRLREAKSKLHKLGYHSNGEKSLLKWLGKKSTKYL